MAVLLPGERKKWKKLLYLLVTCAFFLLGAKITLMLLRNGSNLKVLPDMKESTNVTNGVLVVSQVLKSIRPELIDFVKNHTSELNSVAGVKTLAMAGKDIRLKRAVGPKLSLKGLQRLGGVSIAKKSFLMKKGVSVNTMLFPVLLMQIFQNVLRDKERTRHIIHIKVQGRNHTSNDTDHGLEDLFLRKKRNVNTEAASGAMDQTKITIEKYDVVVERKFMDGGLSGNTAFQNIKFNGTIVVDESTNRSIQKVPGNGLVVRYRRALGRTGLGRRHPTFGRRHPTFGRRKNIFGRGRIVRGGGKLIKSGGKSMLQGISAGVMLSLLDKIMNNNNNQEAPIVIQVPDYSSPARTQTTGPIEDDFSGYHGRVKRQTETGLVVLSNIRSRLQEIIQGQRSSSLLEQDEEKILNNILEVNTVVKNVNAIIVIIIGCVFGFGLVYVGIKAIILRTMRSDSV